jgi:3',5'-cyclic AMP phosphodiesterase CpdA
MKIAQITDIHIALPSFGTGQPDIAAPSDRRSGLLFTALEHIAQKQPDLVTITGDLLDIPAEILMNKKPGAAVRKKLATEALAVYLRVLELLVKRFQDFIVIPGNHDHEKAFRKVFGARPRSRTIKGFRVIPFWDREACDHFPERRGTQLIRFSRALCSQNKTPQIHLQHFPVTEVDNRFYPHNYRNRASMEQRIVASQRVRLCLSGHFHAGTALVKMREIYFTTCPAFLNDGNPYRVYTINGASVALEEFQTITGKK